MSFIDPRGLSPKDFINQIPNFGISPVNARALLGAIVGKGDLEPSSWEAQGLVPERIAESIEPLPRLKLVKSITSAIDGFQKLIFETYDNLQIETVIIPLFILLVCTGQFSAITSLTQVPLVYLIGGLFGAVFVFVSTYAAKELGILFFLALVVTGQFVLGSLIDHFAWFGAEQQSFTLKRAVGVMALIVGAILVKLK